MFKDDDFFKVFSFLKDPTKGKDLDLTIRANANAEQGLTKVMWETTIDQPAHDSYDYQRLREFMIDWYASHKTLITTQKRASDPRSMPIEHLDELIRCFGFDYSHTFLQDNSKPNFLLDLVNLLKIKGTPESIKKALDYYGLQNLELAEFWLTRNKEGDLKFRSFEDPVGFKNLNLPFTDASFTGLTKFDPHWMMTEAEITTLELTNKIQLPSKTPYFSMRPVYATDDLDRALAIISRRVQDDYSSWVDNPESNVRDINIKHLDVNVSFLEMHLGAIYTMDQYYNYNNTYAGDLFQSLAYKSLGLIPGDLVDFLCYNGQLDYRNDPKSVIVELQDSISRNKMIRDSSGVLTSSEPLTRDEKQIKVAEFYNTFTRDLSTSFYQNNDMVESVLTTLNPDFKQLIDVMLDTARGEEAVNAILFQMAVWTVENVSTTSPNTAAQAVGLGMYPGLKDIINFFKPYRARWIVTESIHIFDYPLLDSIIPEDKCVFDIELSANDYSNYGEKCCETSIDGEPVTCNIGRDTYYNRDTYDCGSYFDIGAAFDKEVDITIEHSYHDKLGRVLGDSSRHVLNDTLYMPYPGQDIKGYDFIYKSHGGWIDMDEEDSTFDTTYGSDLCLVYVFDLSDTDHLITDDGWPITDDVDNRFKRPITEPVPIATEIGQELSDEDGINVITTT